MTQTHNLSGVENKRNIGKKEKAGNTEVGELQKGGGKYQIVLLHI